ncbi:MAG: phosphoribosylformylglycinamidine synthase subunit PurL [Clostridia bacterium]|nr:phosphoribosylformylglycinamidine synthase subunit PurL [Clostridia bacterium]
MASTAKDSRCPWREMGLTDEEHDMICKILGREPSLVETGMFSVMWSEHCSYKNSKPILRTLPTSGKHVLEGPGENAGIVDVGDGIAVVFKIESHNHPSAVEPYQGAATGVGGIIRDIFTMGARPIAILDSLWFGDLSSARNRRLMDGVVSGIAGYGNAVGVATVGGETHFHPSYENNPLVNAMCIGVMRKEDIKRGAARGAGNSVMVIGSRTGRDGIHGATFASADLTEEAVERRSAVQVGDPFREKLLLEACLELVARGCVLGIQDMGAAGLTCSSCEMASRGGTGMIMDLDRVPRRERGMTAYELMLSESQERMLLVPTPGREAEVEEILRKWELEASIVGKVTDDGMVTIIDGGNVVAQAPAAALADDAPVYHRESQKPAYIDELASFDTSSIPPVDDLGKALLALLARPENASKRWIYSQYDHQVGAGAVVTPGSDAAVLRLPGAQRGIAASTDCNSRYCCIDPRKGAAHAVAEAARNVACSGAKPIAITNCLNFGNPYKPEVFWQFSECAAGMAQACEAFETPVTGGNVSFYNEDGEASIRPTPVIGMLGVIDDVKNRVTSGFRNAGDAVVLLGITRDEIGASEYLAAIHMVEAGPLPLLDLDAERRLQSLLQAAAGRGLLASAHDISSGGLAASLAECCIIGSVGAGLTIRTDLAPDRCLFSESAARAVVSVPRDGIAPLLALASELGVTAQLIGAVGGDRLTVAFRRAEEDAPTNGVSGDESSPALRLDLSVAEMAKPYEEAIPCAMMRD